MKKICYAFIFLLSLSIQLCFSQAGMLDVDFSNDGIVTTKITAGHDYGNAVLTQADGKLIVVGYSEYGAAEFVCIRYNVDGSLDTTFDQDGIVTTNVSSYDDIALNGVIQPDGKIVVVGSSKNSSTYESNFAITRYQVDGTLDNSFSDDGKLVIQIGAESSNAYVVKMQADGKIIVAGYMETTTDLFNFVVARFLDNGVLDTSFNSIGYLPVYFNDKIGGIATALSMQSDGRIIVSGYASEGYNGTNDFAIARITVNGVLDTTFSMDGKLTIDCGSSENDFSFSSAIQADGKIVVGGFAFNGIDDDFTVIRLDTDGSLDSTWGVYGKLLTDIGSNKNHAYATHVQADGKIVLAGYTYEYYDNNTKTRSVFCVTRFEQDGTLDDDFGLDGIVTTMIDTNFAYCMASVIQPNGKIVLAGYFYNGNDYDIAVARYISGLNLGIIDFSNVADELFVYPNPIQENAVFEYELMNKESISIYLVNAEGKQLQTFVKDEVQEKGIHKVPIHLSKDLPSGFYMIVLASQNKHIGLSIIK